MEKFCDLNPHLGTTSAYSNLVGSLQNAEVLHYDEYLIHHNKPIDQFLIEHFQTTKPDLLAVSYYPFDDPRNVKLDTFLEIRDNLKIPVVFIWFDFGHEPLRQLAMRVGQVATLNVVVDTYNVPGGNFMPMWVPQDESIFCMGNVKDIAVSFVGSTVGYSTRAHYLNFLRGTVHVSGGQREHRLTIEQYADILKRSKITLNFPDKPDGIIQAKCRIYESMLCGALLLEKENEAIKKWFEPMVHYVPFSSPEDALNKIHYYLANEGERQTIVNNAAEKMKEYSSENWWAKIISFCKGDR